MSYLKTLTKPEVGPSTQKVFDELNDKIGMVPNVYAAVANSPKALNALLSLGDNLTGGEFSSKEIEIIALTVGQANSCKYCLSAHTAIAKTQGLSEEEALQIRSGEVKDPKINALVVLTNSIAITRVAPQKY